MLFSYNFNKTGKILKRLFSITSAVLRHDGNKEDFVDRSSHRRCSVRKDGLRNFSKFTRKHMSQSLFFKIKFRLCIELFILAYRKSINMSELLLIVLVGMAEC